jgi:hypothetical protein
MADGKAIPFGVCDIAEKHRLGIGRHRPRHAQFSVAAIKAWSQHLGSQRHPNARSLTITADCGGSNGNRTRLWKTELQRLADQTGLEINVCHFPPGTSKWNKVEHRSFQLHLQELARPVACLLRGHHQLDRGDDDQHRAGRLRTPRRQRLPQGRGQRRRAGGRQHHPRRVSAMELHHQPIT